MPIGAVSGIETRMDPGAGYQDCTTECQNINTIVWESRLIDGDCTVRDPELGPPLYSGSWFLKDRASVGIGQLELSQRSGGGMGPWVV